MTSVGVEKSISDRLVPVTPSVVDFKVGLISSNSRLGRGVQSLASFVIPGNASVVRHPVRSGVYGALTPGGGGDGRLGRRIGGGRMFTRCPSGFEFGGRFAGRNFSNCGRRVFETPGEGINSGITGAVARAAEGAVRSTLPNAPRGSVREIVSGKPTGRAIQISRNASIPNVGGKNIARRDSAVSAAVNAVVNNRDSRSLLVRRDGVTLSPTVSVEELGKLKSNKDMENGVFVSHLLEPSSMGKNEIPALLATDLDQVVFAFPGGSHLKVGKTRPLTPSESRRLKGVFSRAHSSQSSMNYDAGIQAIVDASNGAIKYTGRFPGVTRPYERVSVEDAKGNRRIVPRWVFEIFLSSKAPQRGGRPSWSIIESGVPSEAEKSAMSINTQLIQKKQAMLEFKTTLYLADKEFSSYAFQVKGVAAVWDPDLPPEGGYRCPEGTRYGGRITDRFGRNCGWNISRRLANTLERVGSGLAESIGDAGRTQRRERRAAIGQRGRQELDRIRASRRLDADRLPDAPAELGRFTRRAMRRDPELAARRREERRQRRAQILEDFGRRIDYGYGDERDRQIRRRGRLFRDRVGGDERARRREERAARRARRIQERRDNRESVREQVADRLERFGRRVDRGEGDERDRRIRRERGIQDNQRAEWADRAERRRRAEQEDRAAERQMREDQRAEWADRAERRRRAEREDRAADRAAREDQRAEWADRAERRRRMRRSDRAAARAARADERRERARQRRVRRQEEREARRQRMADRLERFGREVDRGEGDQRDRDIRRRGRQAAEEAVASRRRTPSRAQIEENEQTAREQEQGPRPVDPTVPFTSAGHRKRAERIRTLQNEFDSLFEDYAITDSVTGEKIRGWDGWTDNELMDAAERIRAIANEDDNVIQDAVNKIRFELRMRGIEREIDRLNSDMKATEADYRNVRNAFPARGLPENPWWRRGEQGDRHREFARRFDRYYDQNDNLTEQGRAINRRILAERQAARGPLPPREPVDMPAPSTEFSPPEGEPVDIPAPSTLRSPVERPRSRTLQPSRSRSLRSRVDDALSDMEKEPLLADFLPPPSEPVMDRIYTLIENLARRAHPYRELDDYPSPRFSFESPLLQKQQDRAIIAAAQMDMDTLRELERASNAERRRLRDKLAEYVDGLPENPKDATREQIEGFFALDQRLSDYEAHSNFLNELSSMTRKANATGVRPNMPDMAEAVRHIERNIWGPQELDEFMDLSDAQIDGDERLLRENLETHNRVLRDALDPAIAAFAHAPELIERYRARRMTILAELDRIDRVRRFRQGVKEVVGRTQQDALRRMKQELDQRATEHNNTMNRIELNEPALRGYLLNLQSVLAAEDQLMGSGYRLGYWLQTRTQISEVRQRLESFQTWTQERDNRRDIEEFAGINDPFDIDNFDLPNGKLVHQERVAAAREKHRKILANYLRSRYQGDRPWEQGNQNFDMGTLNELYVRARQEGDAEALETLKNWVSQIYFIDGVTAKNGVKMRAVPNAWDGGFTLTHEGIRVSGAIEKFNEGSGVWTQIGSFSRTLRFGPTAGDNPHVYHDSMSIWDVNDRNLGWQSVFNPHAFLWLRHAGFKEVAVTAATDGPYVWGRMGFTDYYQETHRALANLFEEALIRWQRGAPSVIKNEDDADAIAYLLKEAKAANYRPFVAPNHADFLRAITTTTKEEEAELKRYLLEGLVGNPNWDGVSDVTGNRITGAGFTSGKFSLTDDTLFVADPLRDDITLPPKNPAPSQGLTSQDLAPELQWIPVRDYADAPGLSVETEQGHVPRVVTAEDRPDLASLRASIDHVRAGGSIADIPNEHIREVLMATSSRLDVDPNSRFKILGSDEINEGAMALTLIFRERDESGRVLPNRGYVAKLVQDFVGEHAGGAVAEVLGWNLLASMGIVSHGATFNGVEMIQQYVGVDEEHPVPWVIIPLASDHIADGTLVRLPDPRLGEPNFVPEWVAEDERAMLAEVMAGFVQHLIQAPDRHDFNGFTMQVFDPTSGRMRTQVIPIDFARAGAEPDFDTLFQYFGYLGMAAQYGSMNPNMNNQWSEWRRRAESLYDEDYEAVLVEMADRIRTLAQHVHDRAQSILDGGLQKFIENGLKGIDNQEIRDIGERRLRRLYSTIEASLRTQQNQLEVFISALLTNDTNRPISSERGLN